LPSATRFGKEVGHGEARQSCVHPCRGVVRGLNATLLGLEEIAVLDHHKPEAADSLLQALRSPHENTRLEALHRVCPCRTSFAVYERYMDEVRRLRKDPSPRVRKVAGHVEEDAGHIELMLAKLDLAEELGVRFGDRNFTGHWRRARQRH